MKAPVNIYTIGYPMDQKTQAMADLLVTRPYCQFHTCSVTGRVVCLTCWIRNKVFAGKV